VKDLVRKQWAEIKTKDGQAIYAGR
jgi:hypothetical protein